MAAAISPSVFRKTLAKFPSGVTIVTTRIGDLTHGMTASAFFSLSMDPPLVGVAVDRRTKLDGLLRQTSEFGVSILAHHQQDLSNHFAGKDSGKAQLPFVEIDGIPLIGGALAHICCDVAERYEGGDHCIYAGRVRYLNYREDDEPLLWYSGQYRSLAR